MAKALGGHSILDKLAQRFIRRDPGPLQPLVIHLLQQQIRQHATEHDASPVVQMRVVVLIQVVDLGGVLADGVHVVDAGLVEIEVRGGGGFGGGDGGDPLVVQRVGYFVLGIEGAAGERGYDELLS